MIALLADGEGDREPVARRRKRACGEWRVSAGRILKVVEIEDKFAGLVEAVGGEAGVKKTASAIGGRGAGGVAKDEEKFGDGGIFQDGLEAEGFSLQRKFSGSGDGLIVTGAHESSEGDCFWRRVGNPLRSDAIGGIGWIQLKSVKSGDTGRMGILDAQSEARFAADDVHVERADGQMRRNFVVIGFGAERLRLRGRARHQKIRRESAGRGIESDDFAFKVKNREMRGAAGGEMDLVVRSRAERIVSRL